MSGFAIQVAESKHKKYVTEICNQYEESAKARGTGIAKRSEEYILQKIDEGKAIIAISPAGKFAGFCYIETWGQGKSIANSGLIVVPEFRNNGLARKIKMQAFRLSRTKYPNRKIFGLTTSLAVMRINSDLGYYPVTFEELTDDPDFWNGCKSCVNYEILKSKHFKNCLCTGMVFDPSRKQKKTWQFQRRAKFYDRLTRIKQALFLKSGNKETVGKAFLSSIFKSLKALS